MEQMLNKIKAYYLSRGEVLFGYLFGSYAQNRNHSQSDVDIAIYLSTYNEDSAHEYKMANIIELQDLVKKPVDLILLNQAPPLLQHEIFKTGILFLEKDHSSLVEYKVKNYYQYLNQLYIMNRFFFEKNKMKIQRDVWDAQSQYN